MSCQKPEGSQITEEEALSDRQPRAPGPRLDTHIHVKDEQIIPEIIDYIRRERLTHFVPLLDHEEFIERLSGHGAEVLPFQWLHPFHTDRLAGWALGYKLHPREPFLRGEPFSLDEPRLHAICQEAGERGRPVLIHTDADRPLRCTMPMAAALARRHRDTSFVACHAGTCAGPYFHDCSGPYTREQWSGLARRAIEASLALLIQQENLYADCLLLGIDEGERTDDPDFGMQLLQESVGELTDSDRRTVVDKLFIGTDFPYCVMHGGPPDSYSDQLRRMQVALGEFDEKRAAQRFLELGPGRRRAPEGR